VNQSDDRTKPSPETRDVEREDALIQAGPDRPPTEEEERDAPTELTDEQRANYEEMAERGAQHRGEGRIP
jgi:hypothetical protein